MKNKTLTYLALSLLCCICACTSVDLCPEAGHPHITDMRVRLNWGDISKDEIPAEMHIVASRIINTWRTRGIINTSIDPATNNNKRNRKRLPTPGQLQIQKKIRKITQ